jgi:hypothetical protein
MVIVITVRLASTATTNFFFSMADLPDGPFLP